MRSKLNEKGSLTLIVITTIFFLLIILGTIFTTMSLKRKSQLVEFEQLKEVYEGDMQEAYEKRKNKITILESDGTPIDINNVANYYGSEVTYNEEIYQLFYADTEGKYSNGEPRIWLQHKGYVSGVQLRAHYETTGLTDTNSIMYQINPDWKRLIGDDLVGKTDEQLNVDAYNNYRGVAYLCNPQNWNDTYLAEGDEEKGAFAIGGVSVEMWCDSYNAARNKISTESDYFSAKAYSQNSTKGYRFKPGGADASTNGEGYGYWTDNVNYPITTFYGNMYRISNTYPWLASPSSNSTLNVCLVNGNGGYLCSNSTSGAYGVRAAVSLPSSIQIKLNN